MIANIAKVSRVRCTKHLVSVDKLKVFFLSLILTLLFILILLFHKSSDQENFFRNAFSDLLDQASPLLMAFSLLLLTQLEFVMCFVWLSLGGQYPCLPCIIIF